MSASIRERTNDQGIELGTGVSWPHIIAGSVLGLATLTAAIVMPLFMSGQPATDHAADANQRVLAYSPDKSELPPPPPENRIRPRLSLPSSEAADVATKPPASEKPKRLSRPVAVVSKPVVSPPVPAEPDKANQITLVPSQKQSLSTGKGFGPDTGSYYDWPESLKRRQFYSEEDLRARLGVESKELDFEATKGATAKLLAVNKKPTPSQRKEEEASLSKDAAKPEAKTPPILEMIAQRDDLKGLPVRNLENCQTNAKEAKILGEMSGTMRSLTSKLLDRRKADNASSTSNSQDVSMVRLLDSVYFSDENWRGDRGARMLMQMLQADTPAVRLQTIKMLAAIKEKSTSAALAHQAVFDLDPLVREGAIKALKGRPSDEYRPVLLEALRYPWPVVADHAAETLVALDDRNAVLDLACLLDRPNPQAPKQNKEKKWVVAELVRVNHLGNCVLCHAPSSDRADPMRGLVPDRDQPLPVVYYESRSGNFVRADVTYLKQDFSITQAVEKPGKWPSQQRFDYLVRNRELSADEVANLNRTKDAKSDINNSYPQREAVLWALRLLTEKDMGNRREDRHEYLTEEFLPLSGSP